MVSLRDDDPLVVAVTDAIRTGEIESLRRLVRENPTLATARIDRGDGASCTLLHVVADWPGHFPNGATTVGVLVEAGADINAPFEGLHTESPLHWAASSDDVDVLDALIKAGADIEASGGIIGGGTPLADAVGFGQWQAARRLVEHGSRTLLWQAAALGLTDRIEEHFAVGTPSPEEVTNAFWHACSARQGGAAELLLEHGADLNWIGWDRVTPLDAAHSNGAGEVIEWLNSKGARRAAELS